ncbi:MAG: MarR family transcriptional regulator [Deltaproteobacteria bacterium]|nr:MarR family transcriptional regulator [Deltaproteobacteria bacterium]
MSDVTPLKAVEKQKPTEQNRLDAATETFIQGAGQISTTLLGMINKVGGQIYALLFLSEEPLSLDDISERLAVSKSNVSINIRLLEDYNLVRKVWIKGSRKDFYGAERVYPSKVLKDFFEKIRRTLKDSITTIERTRSQVVQLKLDIKGEPNTQADFMLEQLNLISRFYNAADRFIEDFYQGNPINIKLLQHIVTSKDL